VGLLQPQQLLLATLCDQGPHHAGLLTRRVFVEHRSHSISFTSALGAKVQDKVGERGNGRVGVHPYSDAWLGQGWAGAWVTLYSSCGGPCPL
jgi:hypothetical protein